MSGAQYEGWKNYATWNVALWINNDFPLYNNARIFMGKYQGTHPYKAYILEMNLESAKTPDRINWISKQLDYSELNAMMRELIS